MGVDKEECLEGAIFEQLREQGTPEQNLEGRESDVVARGGPTGQGAHTQSCRCGGQAVLRRLGSIPSALWGHGRVFSRKWVLEGLSGNRIGVGSYSKWNGDPSGGCQSCPRDKSAQKGKGFLVDGRAVGRRETGDARRTSLATPQ